MACAVHADGVHDCTGAGQRCACGYEFRVPPIMVSIEIFDKSTELYGDHFNCENVDVAIDALERAIRRLRTRTGRV